MAQIECNQGFMMEGSAQAIVACQDSGKWLRAAGLKCKCCYFISNVNWMQPVPIR